MARFGKGSGKNIASQARSFVRSQTGIGQARHGDNSGKIHSIRTAQEMARALARAGNTIRERHGISSLREITPEMAREYLKGRAESIGQKGLDNERRALQLLGRAGFAMEGVKLERIRTDAGEIRYPSGRAYTPEQVSMIAGAQREHNALATRIAHAAGLRQHELYTLRPAHEQPVSAHRNWSPDRFAGREGVIYTVRGKGGLIREVLIPHNLANRLEARRLAEPVMTRDQGIRYQKLYHIGAGRSWAASFRTVAERAIGWHQGPHGVRHAYAQERMRELQSSAFPYRRALAVVSQELGHFRPEITEVYLR